MNREKQIDIITDLLIDFDEMGFVPTTACPDPEAYAVEWRRKITEALEKVCKQSEGENISQMHPSDEFICDNNPRLLQV